MIIWFFEIPIVFIVIAAILLFVLGSVLVETITNAMVLLGIAVMGVAIPIFIVSTALQHINLDWVKKCDRICTFLIINGAVLFLVGFLGKIFFEV